jgi:feruloyl esterase
MKPTQLLTLLTSAQQHPPPTTPQTNRPPPREFLYTVNATLGPRWTIGDTSRGSRVVIPITGGTFSGPRLRGTVTNLGADWGVTDERKVFFPDTRYNLRTDDGVDIYIQTYGPTQPDLRTLLRGTFEVGKGTKYEWLNYVMATGVLRRSEDFGNYVVIDMWQVSNYLMLL